MHTYQAESEVELNLSVGDYVVVRKVRSSVELHRNIIIIVSDFPQ